MQSRAAANAILACLSIVALVFAGCGSTKMKTVEVTPPHVTNYVPPPAPRSVVYTVPVTPEAEGAPPGEPGASGSAVFSVNANTDEFCWKFSNLTHVTSPTVARVYRFVPPRGDVRDGFKLDPHYRPSGCAPENLIFLGLVGAKPQEFWVSIHSAQYPEGAARAQL